eukprot:9810495-Karenia_brevis.AAC.1
MEFEKTLNTYSMSWSLEQHVIYSLMRMADGRGTDVRLSPLQAYEPKLWPRVPLNTHYWQWQTLQSYSFRSTQHINVLELRALLNYVRMRGRKLHKHNT